MMTPSSRSSLTTSNSLFALVKMSPLALRFVERKLSRFSVPGSVDLLRAEVHQRYTAQFADPLLNFAKFLIVNCF